MSKIKKIEGLPLLEALIRHIRKKKKKLDKMEQFK